MGKSVPVLEEVKPVLTVSIYVDLKLALRESYPVIGASQTVHDKLWQLYYGPGPTWWVADWHYHGGDPACPDVKPCRVVVGTDMAMASRLRSETCACPEEHVCFRIWNWKKVLEEHPESERLIAHYEARTPTTLRDLLEPSLLEMEAR